jgi:hypothetical protein
LFGINFYKKRLKKYGKTIKFQVMEKIYVVTVDPEGVKVKELN